MDNKTGDSQDTPPLKGVVVIDLTQIYQGPYATLLMAKAGADVVKIEPINGEPSRLRAKVGRGSSLSMLMLNTNKKGVTLNLKSEEGRRLLMALVKKADVLVENYAPGVMDRLGVGWEVLKEVNDRLIYASGTGYGLSGPDRDRLAMDLTIQATSGAMSITGMPDGPPLRAGPAIADFLGGIHLYGAITTALYRREKTNKGALVEVAMQDCLYPTLASNLTFCYNSDGKVPPRVGNRHGGLALAPYNVYRTNDGYVAMVCVKEEHWRNLVKAMAAPELLEDERFATNVLRVRNLAEVDRVVEAWTSSLSKDEIASLAQLHKVPCAPVRDLTEVMNDPHMHQRGMLERFDDEDLGEVVLPNSPLNFHGTPRIKSTAMPGLGEHNDEIYSQWLGLAQDELDALKTKGVI